MLKKFFSKEFFSYKGVSDAETFRKDYLRILFLFLFSGVPLAAFLFTYILTGMNIQNYGDTIAGKKWVLIFISYGIISTFAVYVLWLFMHFKRFRSYLKRRSDLKYEIPLAILLHIPLVAILVGILFAVKNEVLETQKTEELSNLENVENPKNFFKKYKIAISIILVILLIRFCPRQTEYEKLTKFAKESKKAQPHLLVDGQPEPPWPVEKENQKTMLGVDVNHNGIRDDVEIWINRNYENPYLRKALYQYARDLTKELVEVSKHDSSITYSLNRATDSSLQCLIEIAYFLSNEKADKRYSENVDSALKINKLIIHPDFRNEAHREVYHLLSGRLVEGVETSHKSNKKFLFCNFKVEKDLEEK